MLHAVPPTPILNPSGVAVVVRCRTSCDNGGIDPGNGTRPSPRFDRRRIECRNPKNAPDDRRPHASKVDFFFFTKTLCSEKLVEIERIENNEKSENNILLKRKNSKTVPYRTRPVDYRYGSWRILLVIHDHRGLRAVTYLGIFLGWM